MTSSEGVQLQRVKGITKAEGIKEQAAEDLFGPKREEITRGWREIHREELHDLCSSQNYQ